MKIKKIVWNEFPSLVEQNKRGEFKAIDKIVVDKIDEEMPTVILPVEKYLAVKNEGLEPFCLTDLTRVTKIFTDKKEVETLHDLVRLPAVSGYERTRVSYLWNRLLKLKDKYKFRFDMEKDAVGNIVVRVGPPKAPVVMAFIAHMDEPACSIVRTIAKPILTNDGSHLHYYMIQMLGGTQGADWENRIVDVYIPSLTSYLTDGMKTKKGCVYFRFKGRIKSEKELHMLSRNEYLIAPQQIENYYRFQVLELFEPFDYDEEINQHLISDNAVYLGYITFERDVRVNGTLQTFTSPGLDDCIGVSTTLLLLEDMLKRKNKNISCYFIFSTGEEKGLLGARSIVHKIPHLDIGIALDVFPAYHYSLEAEAYKKDLLIPGSGVVVVGESAYGTGGHSKLIKMLLECEAITDKKTDDKIKKLEERITEMKAEYIIAMADKERKTELENEMDALGKEYKFNFNNYTCLNIAKTYNGESGDDHELAKTGAMCIYSGIVVSGIHSGTATCKLTDLVRIRKFYNEFIKYVEKDWNEWN